MGMAKRLKEADPGAIVVGAEPAEWFKTGIPGPRE